MDNAGLSAVARLTGVTVDDTRGSCRKCGRTGHLTFQCRNFVSISPTARSPAAASFPPNLAEQSAAQKDAASALLRARSPQPSSSNSSSDSDSHELRRKHRLSHKRKKRKEKHRHKEKHKHKKSKKKRRRDSLSVSSSDSD